MKAYITCSVTRKSLPRPNEQTEVNVALRLALSDAEALGLECKECLEKFPPSAHWSSAPQLNVLEVTAQDLRKYLIVIGG